MLARRGLKEPRVNRSVVREPPTLESGRELDIRLFGQASVGISGTPVKFGKRATTLALIAMVVLREGRPVARDSLAFTLFPEEDEDGARSELRRYLYRTNKALPTPRRGNEPWLIVDNETVRWNVDGGAYVDVTEFVRLAGDPSMQPAAIELYTGDLLEDVYDDWIVSERERLRTLYLRILNDVIERNRVARNHSLALAYTRRLLAADPWREDIVRRAMEIHYASGDASGALVEYDRFGERLRKEMGIAPMAETIALRDAIVRGEPVIGSIDASLDQRTDFAGGRAVRGLPFTGRDAERARIEAQWDRAARGFGGVVIVSGEAGVGKTRLVGEIARLADAQGARVYTGTTSFPESLPYQCIVEALRAAFPVLVAQPLDSLTLGVLAGILPELRAQGRELPEVTPLPPERESARLFDSLAAAAKSLCGSRPLMLVLEDLHWAADATIDALAAIARRIDRSRLLIVGTYREEETPATHPLRRLADALGAERRMTEVTLGRFSRKDVAEMIAGVTDLRESGDALVDQLYGFSEGNPLFLSQAIANAVESDGDSAGDLPMQGIGSVVAARTARLGEHARIVAEIAAVCGYGCSVDVVRDVAGLSAAQALEAFNELLDRRLVRESGARESFDYVFTHHLIGESIYDRIDGDVRARRHARVAYVLEERAARRQTGVARDLARHYALAGLLEQAGRWYARAAYESAAVYANDDAVQFATLAVERVRERAAIIDALLVREEANARLGNREAQALDLDRLDALADTSDLRCRVLARRVALLRASDDRQAEREAVAALRQHASVAGDRYWQGRAACADARLLVATSDYAGAKDAAREAVDAFESAGTPANRIEALSALIEADVWTGEFKDAEHLLEGARTIAIEAHDRSSLAETLMQAASLATGRLEYARAADVSEQAAEEYRAIGDRVGEAHALVGVAAAAIRISQWGRGEAANVAAAQVFDAIGDSSGLARVMMNLGFLHARCGDLETASERFARAGELYERLGDRRNYAASLVNESFVASARGLALDAKQRAQTAVGIAAEIGYPLLQAIALANLGGAESILGELDAAIEHMERGYALEQELGQKLVGNLAEAALARVKHGELHVAAEMAEQIMAADRARFEAAFFPPLSPWTAACVFHWSGDQEAQAQSALQLAYELSTSIAASIDVPELRAHFDALPFNKAIAVAVNEGIWPAMPG